jgi:SAM-dependent methyltransferase
MKPHAETEAWDHGRAVWDAMAAGWEASRDDLWADTQVVSDWLVEQIDPRPGDTVLELATGVGDTGLAAARRVGEMGRVLITDFAPEMVAAARRRATELGITNVEFRVLDAERMELATASVDGVVCRWGYMHMADPGAAFAETRRVLRPGGRLAFTVWAGPEFYPLASLISHILVMRGHLVPPPTAPGVFALAEPGRIRELVLGAGFTSPRIEEMSTHRRFADFEAYWRYLTDLAGAISPVLRGLSNEERTVVQAELHEAATPYAVAGGYDFPALCLNTVTS